MDWTKVDAYLASALDESPDSDERYLVVFIQLAGPPAEPDLEVLHALGVADVSGPDVLTATLSPREVAELSDQPWVTVLRLSQRRHLVQHAGE